MAVVGLGLMGGSVARALASLDDRPRVIGVDPDPLRGSRLRDEGAIARFELPETGAAGQCELVVLACPLGAALRFYAEEAPRLPDDIVLTDLVSLNAPILRAAQGAGVAARTVTGHPMCGSAESGLDAARADLFQGARVWLSARPEAEPALRRRVAGFWEALGGQPSWIEEKEHDRVMAWVSHLPQLVASALAGALDAAGFRPDDLGPGGRDMIRLAGSSPDIWRDLLEHSAPVAGTGLSSVSRGLEAVADLLARRELDRIHEFMELTRAWARGEASLADAEEP